jgi:hypothetical protein
MEPTTPQIDIAQSQLTRLEGYLPLVAAKVRAVLNLEPDALKLESSFYIIYRDVLINKHRMYELAERFMLAGEAAAGVLHREQINTTGKYLYKRRDWDNWHPVDFAGQLMVCHTPGTIPGKLSDSPADAQFKPVG